MLMNLCKVLNDEIFRNCLLYKRSYGVSELHYKIYYFCVSFVAIAYMKFSGHGMTFFHKIFEEICLHVLIFSLFLSKLNKCTRH